MACHCATLMAPNRIASDRWPHRGPGRWQICDITCGLMSLPFFRVKLSFQNHPSNFNSHPHSNFNSIVKIIKFKLVWSFELSCSVLLKEICRDRKGDSPARCHPYDGYHNPRIDMMWWHMSCSRVLKCLFKKLTTASRMTLVSWEIKLIFAGF